MFGTDFHGLRLGPMLGSRLGRRTIAGLYIDPRMAPVFSCSLEISSILVLHQVLLFESHHRTDHTSLISVRLLAEQLPPYRYRGGLYQTSYKGMGWEITGIIEWSGKFLVYAGVSHYADHFPYQWRIR